ncbi:DUF4183 domain-containing protein [Lentibacillus jeotgali]|uniref:DUF4183 domain-containing protein n=1 Tax=Lentibacillus jeotgali TaxID=558169 RepID=UPI0002625876|nr:DUF4183 domain-containing protein [Lentibacillus jeotgali]
MTNQRIAPGTTLTIDAASFFADDGTAVTALPELEANNSYYNVYVNGVLQMQGLTTYTPGASGTGALVINVPADSGALPRNSPVVLEIINYYPETAVTVTS